MPRSWQSSVILVVVFGLGLAAGIAGMVWAWPGLHARFSNQHPRETYLQYMQRTLKLTPAQVQQVGAVYTHAYDRRHAAHLPFEPDYRRICEEYIQVAQKEHDAFVPLRQQEMGELQTVLTPIQWQVFQQQQAARRHPPRLPDLCRHLDPLPPGAASPRPPPKH